MIGFTVGLFGVYLAVQLILTAWRWTMMKWIQLRTMKSDGKAMMQSAEDQNFFVEGRRAALQLVSFAQLPLAKVKAGDIMATRVRLFVLGLMPVAHALPILVTAVVAGGAAWLGLLTGLQNLFDRFGEPASFILFLTDASLLPLLFCLGVGVLLGWVLPWRGLSLVVSIAFLFPYLLTIPGAVLLVLGEFLVGASLRQSRLDSEWSRAWRLRAGVSLFTVFLFWLLGGLLRSSFVEFGFDGQQLLDRAQMFAILLTGCFVLDTSLSLVLLHFGWTLDKARRFLTDGRA